MKAFLFEFEDLKWFPNFLRVSMTDYLRYFLNFTNFYKPTTQLLYDCLKHAGSGRCVDLCSGGGGAVTSIIQNLKSEKNIEIHFTLTDKFPNEEAFSFIKRQLPQSIDFVQSPVDATSVPKELGGVRTIYSAIHHFDEETIRAVIQDAAEASAPVAIFDGGDKSLLTILGIILLHPIAFMISTPFFKPFRLSRLFFTYIIPLIPVCTIWDGVVSIMRLYEPQALLKIAEEVSEDYHWQAGKVRNGLHMNITYLTGVPK